MQRTFVTVPVLAATLANAPAGETLRTEHVVLTGLARICPVQPKRVKGVVLRPRWHAEAGWGSIVIPPRARYKAS